MNQSINLVFYPEHGFTLFLLVSVTY